MNPFDITVTVACRVHTSAANPADDRLATES